MASWKLSSHLVGLHGLALEKLAEVGNTTTGLDHRSRRRGAVRGAWRSKGGAHPELRRRVMLPFIRSRRCGWARQTGRGARRASSTAPTPSMASRAGDTQRFDGPHCSTEDVRGGTQRCLESIELQALGRVRNGAHRAACCESRSCDGLDGDRSRCGRPRPVAEDGRGQRAGGASRCSGLHDGAQTAHTRTDTRAGVKLTT